MSVSKLLIADDERHIAEGLQMLLQEDGYEAETATDGEEAWQKVEEGGFGAPGAAEAPTTITGNVTVSDGGTNTCIAALIAGAAVLLAGGGWVTWIARTRASHNPLAAATPEARPPGRRRAPGIPRRSSGRSRR